jgi:hypothetical protein
MMLRRGVLGALLVGAALPAHARTPAGVWFDPTQLPSYSGRLDRWVSNPAGEVDRGLFREGAQFVFPPAEAEALALAIQRGNPLTVWGVRARSAPVITMLAWSRSEAEGAIFVERPAWFASMAPGSARHLLAGRILAPLLTPQGEPMGVILAEGGAVRLPVGVHRALGNRLASGEAVAAEGRGTPAGELLAIDAERLGPDAASLAPLPEPAR